MKTETYIRYGVEILNPNGWENIFPEGSTLSNSYPTYEDAVEGLPRVAYVWGRHMSEFRVTRTQFMVTVEGMDLQPAIRRGLERREKVKELARFRRRSV